MSGVLSVSQTVQSPTAKGASEAHPDSNPIRSRTLGFRVGDWVQIKSKEEILRSLDANGSLEKMLFMPEMLEFCGRRFGVFKIAHKTCDTVTGSRGRRLENTVHLEGLRCSGADHGGCEAGCLIFWKEAWLPDPYGASVSTACTEETLRRATRTAESSTEDPSYRCQATNLLEATRPLKWTEFDQYVKDVKSGNHSAGHMLRIMLFAFYRHLLSLGIGYRILLAAYDTVQRLRGRPLYPRHPDRIAKGQPTPTEALDLSPGEWVRVKSHEEIRETTSMGGFNRGMRFDEEMAKFCGNTYRVNARVTKILNEKTGKMMHMKNPCIVLENVYCRAECTDNRLGCPRAVNTYWREIWLQRVTRPSSGNSTEV